MNLKKIFYKLFDKNKYLAIKNKELTKKKIKILKKDF